MRRRTGTGPFLSGKDEMGIMGLPGMGSWNSVLSSGNEGAQVVAVSASYTSWLHCHSGSGSCETIRPQ